MKKTLILISIFMIMLVSCSGKKSAVNAAANKTVGLPNPVQGSTAEDIAKELNVKFAVPDDAKNIRYSIIAGKLAQMDFIWNEAECTARIERDAESEDISGFYYNWPNETPCTVGENAGIAKWQITDIRPSETNLGRPNCFFEGSRPTNLAFVPSEQFFPVKGEKNRRGRKRKTCPGFLQSPPFFAIIYSVKKRLFPIAEGGYP